MHKVSEKITAFIPWADVEEEAKKQIQNTASMPFIFKHIAVMPDTHYGMGSTVGTVLATKGAVIPAAVGVDIGCGMIALKTNLARHELGSLATIRGEIERRIPMSAGRFNSRIVESAEPRVAELEATLGIETADKLSPNWREQLGTLGGGNHFIEICIETKDGVETPDDPVWVTLHSGSRGVGNKIGMHYIKIAQKLRESNNVVLPDRDLAYLRNDEPEFNDYIRDLRWAQKFALLNREEMLDRVMMVIAAMAYGDSEYGRFKEFEDFRINCHHNFTQIENHFGEDVWVTRKGAIEASVGKKGMIPGSMGTRSYIVSGLGHPESFNSAPHGAGRRFSRNKARAQFTMEDFDKAMEGIEHRRSEVLLDEIPAAYKDIDVVMDNAKELVKIEAQLKQILNVKGD